ncbi:type II secretion system F family protein [Sinimarinibacterium flocculans]|uniref:type II secretion system F family protein n=1 Tax=Sinimarinibacterium flocculans TaxID=985250 RepID=UPI003518C1C0
MIIREQALQFDVVTYREPEGAARQHVTGESSERVRQLLEAQGYRVVTIQSRRFAIGGIRFRALNLTPRFSVALFSQELLALLDAGLSLVESIDVLSRKAKDGEVLKVLRELHDALREGLSMSQSLERQPHHFTTLYIAAVRSGERTGNVRQALERYLAYHQQMTHVREKVISASVYPALLLMLGALVLFFLMAYVVPRFSRIYEDVGSDLPLLSRMLMQWGAVIDGHVGILLVGALAAISSLTYALARPDVRRVLERRLWEVPGIGEKLRLYQFARFFRTLAMLLRAGIPIVLALEQVRGLLRQPSLEAGLLAATQAIREGKSISTAFEHNGLADPVGLRLLVVGERTGEMPDVMARVAQLYDDDISRWVERFSRLFEPILMIVIGLMIGGIVLLMYMPIFELAGSLQ